MMIIVLMQDPEKFERVFKKKYLQNFLFNAKIKN
jgi:hypothetical protein